MKVVLGYYEKTNHVQTWHMAFWSPLVNATAQYGRHETMCDYGGMFCDPSAIKWSGVMTDTAMNIARYVRQTGREKMSRACKNCLKVLEARISAVDMLAEITQPTVPDFINGQR